MARPFLTRFLHLQNRELGWLAVPQVLHQCSSHRTYIFPCQTCLAFMVFQLLSAALAGLQPNPSAEAAWGFLWLTAQQADPEWPPGLLRPEGALAVPPLLPGVLAVGDWDSLRLFWLWKSWPKMWYAFLSLIFQELHGRFWSFLLQSCLLTDPQWSFCHVHTMETKDATGLTLWGGFSFWLSWRNNVEVFYFVNWHPFWLEHFAEKKDRTVF